MQPFELKNQIVRKHDLWGKMFMGVTQLGRSSNSSETTVAYVVTPGEG